MKRKALRGGGTVRLHPADVDAVLKALRHWRCKNEYTCVGDEKKVWLRTRSITGKRVCVIPVVRGMGYHPTGDGMTVTQQGGERCYFIDIQRKTFQRWVGAKRARALLAPLVAHELTHTLQRTRDRGTELYFDRPTEVEAYLQQVAGEIKYLPLHQRLRAADPVELLSMSPAARSLLTAWEGKPAGKRLYQLAARLFEETQATPAAQRSGARLAEQEANLRETRQWHNLPAGARPLPGETLAAFVRRARKPPPVPPPKPVDVSLDDWYEKTFRGGELVR